MIKLYGKILSIIFLFKWKHIRNATQTRQSLYIKIKNNKAIKREIFYIQTHMLFLRIILLLTAWVVSCMFLLNNNNKKSKITERRLLTYKNICGNFIILLRVVK